MRVQLLSDLHLETEAFDPVPAPAAEALILAGDIDSRWDGLERFAGWPVPVLFVAGNHEFDGRDFDAAASGLRARCAALGFTLLEREAVEWRDRGGRRIRVLGTTRWTDFDAFGAQSRERCRRAAGYYLRLMNATRGGTPFDAEAMRAEALTCRAWLEAQLRRTDHRCDATLVVTHFAPSLRSADPRYGDQPGSASFCNADDDLLAGADVWVHGHLHCRHDYAVASAGGRRTRVISNARGHSLRGETLGHDPLLTFEV